MKIHASVDTAVDGIAPPRSGPEDWTVVQDEPDDRDTEPLEGAG